MTTSLVDTLAAELNKGNLNTLGDVLKQLALGMVLQPIKVTFASLSAAAAVDITTAASFAAATISPALPLNKDGTPARLPAIRNVIALRVTAVGGGATGPRVVTDAGGTAVAPGATGNSGVPGVALLSDDGKTLTFEGTVTGFVLEYVPRPLMDPTSQYAPT